MSLPTRRLGRTGFEVTELALGGYQYTVEFNVPRTDAEALLDVAFEAGVNYVDTAPMYGSGESEELLGRALARHPGHRVHISTKLGWLHRTIVRERGEAAYRDEDSLRRVFEHSLRLLGRDYVEMVFVHEPEEACWGFDYATGEAPVTRFLETLKAEGRIGAIGLGSNRWERARDLVATGRFDVVELANQYNLIQRGIPERIVPVARAHDVGVVVGGPLKGGLFASANWAQLARLKRNWQAPWLLSVGDLAKVEALYRLAEELGVTPAELSVRFLLADPDIHAIIPGARRPSDVEANLAAAAEGPWPAEVLARIREIEQLEPSREERLSWLGTPGATMRGVMFTAQGRAELQDEPAPVCGPGQVLCRTLYSGLTNGTERNVLLGGNYGGSWPRRCGYQNVGRVVAVGDGVEGWEPGEVVFSGGFHQHVAWFAFNAQPADWRDELVVKLPAALKPEQAALLGMASVALHDVRRADVRLGERVLVVGAGGIGLFTAQCARAAGARVTVADLDDRRLALARSLGAATVNTGSAEGWARLKADHGPFDVVIEDSGAPLLDRLIGDGGLLRARGRLVLIAGRDRVDYGFNAGQGREITILQASHFERGDLLEVLRLVGDGLLELAPLVQDLLPVEAAVGVYDRLRDEPNTLSGTVFEWS